MSLRKVLEKRILASHSISSSRSATSSFLLAIRLPQLLDLGDCHLPVLHSPYIVDSGCADPEHRIGLPRESATRHPPTARNPTHKRDTNYAAKQKLLKVRYDQSGWTAIRANPAVSLGLRTEELRNIQEHLLFPFVIHCLYTFHLLIPEMYACQPKNSDIARVSNPDLSVKHHISY